MMQIITHTVAIAGAILVWGIGYTLMVMLYSFYLDREYTDFDDNLNCLIYAVAPVDETRRGHGACFIILAFLMVSFVSLDGNVLNNLFELYTVGVAIVTCLFGAHFFLKGYRDMISF